MLHWQYNSYVLLLVIAAALSVTLAFFAWRRRPASGATPLVLLMLVVAEWSLAYALEVGSPNLQTKHFWAQMQYLGIVTVPVAWLAFVLQYTGRGKWLTRRNMAVLAVEPLLILLLVQTNDGHKLIWRDTSLIASGFPLSYTYGAGFSVNIAYSYLLLLIGAFLLLQSLARSPRVYRGQAAVMLIGALAPWVGNALYVFGLSPFPHLDLTPFAFTLTGLLVTWGLFRFRLLDIVPVARDAVIESMGDGVMVLDTQNRIVDLNPPAQRIIGCSAAEAIGQPAAQVLPAQLSLFERGRDVTPVLSVVEGEAREEIVMGEGEAQRHFDLRIASLCDRRGRLTGRLLVLRDITERKQIEDALRESEERFRGIFENATIGLYRTTPDGRILMANPALVHRLGYSSFEELTQRNLEESGYETESPRSAFKKRVESEGQVMGLESVWVKQDGTTLFVRESAKAIRDEAGNTLYYEGMVEDITDRKRAEEALKRQAVQLATLNRIGRHVASILDQQELLQDAVNAVREDLGYLQAAVLLVDEEASELYVAAATDNFWEVIPDGYRQSVGKGAIGIAAETGEMILVKDAFNDPRVYRVGEWFSPSALATPIKTGGQVIGVLEVEADAPNAFDENDRIGLEIMADQIATAIENARLYQETQQRALEQETLREAALALTTALDRDQVIDRILAQLQRVAPYDSASVQLLREDRMEIVGGRGFPNLPNLMGISFPTDGDTPYSEVVRTQAPFIVEDAPSVYEAFREDPHRQAVIRSWLGVPMLIGERLVGMIALDKGEPGFYTQEHARLAETFAAQAAVALENAWLHEGVRRQLEQLAVLYQVAEAGSRILELQPLLQRLLDRILAITGMHIGAIYQLDQANQQLCLLVHRGLLTEFVARVETYAPGEGITGRALVSGQTMIFEDALDVPEVREKARLAGFRSQISLPLKAVGKVIGVLNLNSKDPRAWPPDEIRWLEAVAGQAAIAIENAHLFEEIEERRMYLETVLGAAPDAIVALDACQQIVEWNAGAERLFGYSWEEAIGQNIDHLITSPDVFEEATEFTQMIMGGLEVSPLETIRYRKDGSPVDVILAGSPILVEGELIGIVAVYTDISARVQMEETLRILALLDELTGLYNRRGFSILAEQQLKMAHREKRKLLLLFADLDGMKRINDTFGHEEGDRALVEAADVLRETFRESDVIARFGGDEFVVLAIETNGAPAEALTHRLQENLEARNAGEGRLYDLSLSVGLAHYNPEQPCSIDELVARADRAMYERKRGNQKA